jgi:2,4-didehydro-3-deoxy-L-rhamnonate hydrolase
VKWDLFIKNQAGNPRYLKPGDQVVATIRTDDEKLDLGTQHNSVRAS